MISRIEICTRCPETVNEALIVKFFYEYIENQSEGVENVECFNNSQQDDYNKYVFFCNVSLSVI